MNKIDDLNSTVTELRPDIVLVTETWCNHEISDAYLQLDGYELNSDLRVDRADTTMGRGGGLIVFTKLGLTVFKLDNLVIFNQYCTFKIYDITFFVIYRSPNAPPSAMDGLAGLVKSAPRNTVFIGDFNLPEVRWDLEETMGRSKQLREAMAQKFMEQLVDFPTQVRGNTLDIIITDIPDRFTNVTPGEPLGSSDHISINVEISIGKRTFAEAKKKVRNWRKANFDEMRATLSMASWPDLFQDLNAEEKWEVFRDHLQAAVDKSVPLKPVSPLGRPPWFSRDIAAALRHKRRIWRQEGRSAAFKEANKQAKNIIRRARRAFEKRLASSSDNNKRPFFAYVKRKTRARPTVGPLNRADGSKVTSDKDMADVLNSFFSSVFTQPGAGQPHTAGPTTTAGLDDITITEELVTQAIKSKAWLSCWPR